MSSMPSIAAESSALNFKIDIAVAKKSLDAAKQQGAAINQLLQDNVNLSKAAGKGSHFDRQG